MKTNCKTKLISEDEAKLKRQQVAETGQVMVWTNGCFDVLHAGHVDFLSKASELGDILIVGLNSDHSVSSLKGNGRPIFTFEQRATVLASIAVVDFVIEQVDNTPSRILGLLQPDISCKGADYRPPSGKPIPEASVIEQYGGQLIFIDLMDGLSSSSIIDRLKLIGLD